ncbi:MAG: hypothetical protein JO306_06925, partial [Gemmatimonadetes bacterium]|nr:hypothetical protein [Gemmatimonadota bacterium]
MSVARSLTLAVAAAFAVAPVAASAQAARVLAAERTPADSARTLRTARQAQAAFERTRYAHLPWTNERGNGGWCDEHIGRFCIWKNDTETDWQPPPEHAEVQRERAELVAALDQAAAASPGDAWVAGQRVRYLVEAGRFADAAHAAAACRAEQWWCAALAGYAAHYAGDYPAAETAFAAALTAMPADEREAWESPSPVLADGDARALRRMPPPERAAMLRRIWWLADPFWTQPGNDRLTEHYARLVADRFQDRAKNTEGIFWADDLREILIRWGQPIGWERVRPLSGMMGGLTGVTTHYPPSFELIPTLAMARDPFRIRAADWKTDERDAHSLYAPPGVRRFDPLPHQVAVFRRGSEADVVAAFAMKPDSLPPQPTLEAGVAVMRDPDGAPLVRTVQVQGTRGVLRIAAAPEPTMLSLETRERTSRRAARARFGVDLQRPEDRGVSISDILLLEQPDARPQSLDAAAPLARGSTRVRPGERIAMYWEMYGVAGDDSVTTSLAVVRRSGRGTAPVRTRWTQAA